jgi:macrolide transport system ATP-binding/permease protein
VQYSNQNWTTTVQGVNPTYPSITNWQIAARRGITAEDYNKANLVAVIGQTVYHQLFSPGENPIGASILVKSVPLQVIGVLVAKGQSVYGTDQDDLVMTPFTTAERKVLGVAAPTSAQTPLNWPYLPWPNPYNLQPRLTGFANQIYVQAVSQPLVHTGRRATRSFAAIASSRVPSTISTYATSVNSLKLLRAQAGLWRFCLRPWRRFRFWSGASVS